MDKKITVEESIDIEAGKVQGNEGYYCIDCMKFIMSIFVIAIHTGPLDNVSKTVSGIVYNCFFSLAVPYFFLASGFLLGKRLQTPFSSYSNKAILETYEKKIFKMYLCWSVIYIPLAVHGFRIGGYTFGRALKSYLNNLFFVGEHYNSWQLWYLLSTIWAVFFLWISSRLKCRFKTVIIISFLVSIFCFALTRFMQCLSDGNITVLEIIVRDIVSSTIKNGRILTGIVYIPIGIGLAKYTISYKNSLIMWGGGTLFCLCTDNQITRNYFIMVASIGLFETSTLIKLKKTGLWRILRGISTKIYLIHMYIYTFVYLWLYGEKVSGFIPFFLTTIISIILAFLFESRFLWQKSKIGES